jgi:hypothetical protein
MVLLFLSFSFSSGRLLHGFGSNANNRHQAAHVVSKVLPRKKFFHPNPISPTFYLALKEPNNMH